MADGDIRQTYPHGYRRPYINGVAITQEFPLGETARTPARGWAVLLLFRAHGSSVILISYTFGLFLPFIREELDISQVEAGLLQGVWWVTAALVSLPAGTWFSRLRPVPLVLVSMVISLPFLMLQALATGFPLLFAARLLFVLCHVITAPARTLLLQQWAAPRQFAQINSVGLSQHSVILALAVSTSALLITVVGSWRTVYWLMVGLFLVQILTWALVAREAKALAPDLGLRLRQQTGTPLRAIAAYPQSWILAAMMFFLSATWTAIVTFLPTLWFEERGLAPTLSGPLLGFLYYGLIPSALFGGLLARKVGNRKLLLGVPALLNMVFGLAIILNSDPVVLMLLITGLGMVWVATPAINVLPFEFPGIQPREVAVISSLVTTFSGLGFAAGPVLTGVVAEQTGSVQTGLIVLCLLTGLGAIVSLFYPARATANHTAISSK